MDPLVDQATASIDTMSAMIQSFFALIPQIIIALTVFIIITIVGGFIKNITTNLISSRANKSVGVAIGRIVHMVVIFAGLLVAVAIIAPSVGAAELIQILGVGSVAIGFAFRDILQNFLAGLIILLRQPFTVGDWIKANGYEGIVREISTRSTWIRTFDGQDVSIPNGQVFTNAFTIVTRDPIMRTDYQFGIGYDADIDKAKDTILKAVKSVDAVTDDPAPDIGVWEFADSSINLRARWWTTTDDFYAARMAVLEAVKKAMDNAQIDIPYPHRQVLMQDELIESLNDNENRAANA
ncbi:mechanosensitive ion channel family protein [Maritalea mediterranea]|uniref:Small-conductance mechanosensitive channel n=1 Tax=Maritalea mediterranea TaxID=2909667 RepID=A0ABS9E8L3_9HYPH|nr:mechanosensitive ion channel family protein [Maritalea mediterranea]MCF4099197.1 mechanosensitive ion channel family protein [Maritalea mediterranea]